MVVRWSRDPAEEKEIFDRAKPLDQFYGLYIKRPEHDCSIRSTGSDRTVR